MKWQKQSAAWRDRLDISPSYRPWTSRPEFLGRGINHTNRVLDLMDLVTAERLRQQNVRLRQATPAVIEKLMTGTYLDISQSHERRTVSYAGELLPTLTTSSVMYSFSEDAVVTSKEMFRWHGFPRTLVFPPEISETQLKGFIGNSMAAPCLAQAFLSLYALLCEKSFEG